jgi:hypothetical protein
MCAKAVPIDRFSNKINLTKKMKMKSISRVFHYAAIALMVGGLFNANKVSAQSAFHGPLKKSPTNGRYFRDDIDRAIYLTGSHTWNNFQDGGSSTRELLPTVWQNCGTFDYTAYRLPELDASAWPQLHSIVDTGKREGCGIRRKRSDPHSLFTRR